jgi:DNA-binding CsgD family transcriptional regulator
MNRDPVNRPVRKTLSKLERRTLFLKGLGYSYKQIAYTLSIREHTIRTIQARASAKWWFINYFACVAYLDRGELWW